MIGQAGKRKKRPKQEPPAQFRPGPELGQLVSTFASDRRIMVNDTYKNLAALAVVGLDVRYYELLSLMAAAMTGRNAFVRATIQIHTAMQAATRLKASVLAEPDRTMFLIDTVREFVTSMGQSLPAEVPSLVLARIGVQPEPEPCTRTKAYPAGSGASRRRTVKASLIGKLEGDDAPPVEIKPEEPVGFQSTDYGRAETERERLREGQ